MKKYPVFQWTWSLIFVVSSVLLRTTQPLRLTRRLAPITCWHHPVSHRGPTKGWIISYLTIPLSPFTLDRHPIWHWPGSWHYPISLSRYTSLSTLDCPPTCHWPHSWPIVSHSRLANPVHWTPI
jgi:hypothetical protein